MEEDIKKCEALLGSERWVLGTQDKKAIENLLKGYRKLEEELKREKKWRIRLEKENEDTCNEVNNNYIRKSLVIPKSKIKEKIEELESKIKATFCKYMTEEDYYNNKFLSSDVAEDYEVLEVRKLISNRNLLQELMEE